MLTKTQIAKIISRFFDPFFEGPLIVWLLSQVVPTKLNRGMVFSLILFFSYFLPAGIFLLSLKLNWISDWDITKRKERYFLFGSILISILICLLIFYFLGEINLLYFYLKLTFPFAIFFFITLFWKISGHLLMNSFLLLLFFLYLHNSVILLPGVFLLILVGWSRVYLKKHNWGQVISGGMLTLISLIKF